MKTSESRLNQSFLDISLRCIQKASDLYKFKESSLVKAAEKVVYFGVNCDDCLSNVSLREYFSKVQEAFDKDNQLKIYLNSDFVFLFECEVLIDIFPVHSSVRDVASRIWKNNLCEWKKLNFVKRTEYMSDQILYFQIENDSRGEHYDYEDY